MSEVWDFSGEPVGLDGSSAATTLVEGSSFCISAASGDVQPGAATGLFVRDTRILSEWVLEVDGAPVEPLSVMVRDPFHAVFVTRARPRPGAADSTLLVVRERVIGDGMRETLRLRNLGRETSVVTLELRAGADFANLFEVKEGRVRPHHGISVHAHPDLLELRQDRSGRSRSVLVAPREDGTMPPRVRPGILVWQAVVPARGEWTCDLAVEPTLDGESLQLREHDEDAGRYARARRRAGEWRAGSPVVHTRHSGLARTLARSVEDLGALRIDDPEHPERVTVAAGAPWFMALFGRDSILSSWMTLPIDTRLALGTLQALADQQGTRVDPVTEEEPGRILHEVRFGDSEPVPGEPEIYYGSVDATPLFVMLLGELRRWGIEPAAVDALLPAADRALEWISRFGDRDGDGFVEYQRATDRGLRNQGWKDSFDGVNFADGRLAEAPIALCEVQGYVYSAYLARAHFAREAGDEELRAHWAGRAAELRAAFNEQLWLPDRGWFAVGLDRDKRPIDALASNMGHCLWTGIVDEDKAQAVAAHLLGEDLFSGWGVRTLGASMGAYNPLSYHNGSVWPHDNAIIAAGLARYGFVDEAQRIAEGVLAAADAFGGRLPELFCGFARSDFRDPVPFPTSCSPQAWASATPLHLLRSMLRFSPGVPHGTVHLAPIVPAPFLPLRLDNVALGGSRVSLEVTRDGFVVVGLPEGVALVREPRRTETDLFD
ncbi:MAG TPA: glycogen debranching N-terminal domain-containing protein [Phycicoccus sp.]|nr:glycogen debranching N-terminal domain-containing protein [Phycicoccus sp.]